MDVDGTVVTQADQVSAAIAKAAKSRPSNNSTLQLLEADHVFNPDKQDAPGARCYRNPHCCCPRHAAAEVLCLSWWYLC